MYLCFVSHRPQFTLVSDKPQSRLCKYSHFFCFRKALVTTVQMYSMLCFRPASVAPVQMYPCFVSDKPQSRLCKCTHALFQTSLSHKCANVPMHCFRQASVTTVQMYHALFQTSFSRGCSNVPMLCFRPASVTPVPMDLCQSWNYWLSLKKT